MNFKAAVLVEQNKPLEIAELTVPDTLAVGQVLVKMEAATICGAQIREVTGDKGPDYYLPHMLGHEGCGIVEAVGPGVTFVSKGDLVVLHWRKGSGINAPFRSYHWKERDMTIGSGNVTTFSEYTVVSENRVTPIRKDIPPLVASLLGCAVTTGLGLINNEAQLKIGQSIAVIGCGGVGLNVIQGAALAGAHPIIAMDRYQEAMELAEEFGATEWWPSPSILEYLGRKRPWADVVVDMTGNPAVIESALEMVRPGGKLILVGQPRHDEVVMFRDMAQHYKGKTILDSQGGLTDPSIDIPRYVDLYLVGKLNLDRMVTDTFPLESINFAFAAATQASRSGRIGLVMNHG